MQPEEAVEVTEQPGCNGHAQPLVVDGDGDLDVVIMTDANGHTGTLYHRRLSLVQHYDIVLSCEFKKDMSDALPRMRVVNMILNCRRSGASARYPVGVQSWAVRGVPHLHP